MFPWCVCGGDVMCCDVMWNDVRCPPAKLICSNGVGCEVTGR